MKTVQLEYRENHLGVEVGPGRTARLFVNNIQRAEESGSALPCRLKLSSTVQTDYEWHEFVEADIRFDEATVEVSLSANQELLVSESFQLEQTL